MIVPRKLLLVISPSAIQYSHEHLVQIAVGTCVIAIAMLDDLQPGTVPGLTSGSYAPSDKARWNLLGALHYAWTFTAFDRTRKLACHRLIGQRGTIMWTLQTANQSRDIRLKEQHRRVHVRSWLLQGQLITDAISEI